MKLALLLAALTVPAVTSAADSRWEPWLGCWELVDDQRREPLVGEADPTAAADVPTPGLACLEPTGSGVKLTTTAEGDTFLEESLSADGQRHPVERNDCRGFQENDWSSDGRRLYTRAELECEDGRELRVSGLSLLVPRATWVDIQVVSSSAGRAVLVRRYRPASERAMEQPGLPPAAVELTHPTPWSAGWLSDPLTAEDVAEAAAKVEPEVLEAAVLEHRQGFDLDSDTLIALDDAGVRPGLIDLMVALSYPDRFAVKRERTTTDSSGWTPSYYGPGLSPYALYRPYYLAPFASYYWYAPYHPRYIVQPVATPALSQGLVSRQGYTQVSERPSSSRRARHRGGSRDGYVSGSGSSSSSGGAVSGQGYSSGGSGSTRTAKPRRK